MPKKPIKVPKAPEPEKPHHSGKGTRARLNTAAERHMFNAKYSQ